MWDVFHFRVHGRTHIRMPHDSLPTSTSTTSVERVRTFDTLLTFPCIARNGGAIKITLHGVHAGDSGRPMELVIETMRGSTRDGWAEIYLGEREIRPALRDVSENLPTAEAHPVRLCVGSHVGDPPSVPLMGSQQHLLEGAPGLTRFVVGQPADPSPARSNSRSPLPGPNAMDQ